MLNIIIKVNNEITQCNLLSDLPVEKVNEVQELIAALQERGMGITSSTSGDYLDFNIRGVPSAVPLVNSNSAVAKEGATLEEVLAKACKSYGLTSPAWLPSIVAVNQVTPSTSRRSSIVSSLDNKITELQNPHINSDRAYILIQNLQFFLDTKKSRGEELTTEDTTFINRCIEMVRQYRKETKDDFNVARKNIHDGSAEEFWETFESGHEKVAAELQAVSMELWNKLANIYNPEHEYYPDNVGNTNVDPENDFTTDGLVDKHGKPTTLLPVSPVAQITAAVMPMFKIKDGKKIVVTRDMHKNPARDNGFSVWDKPNDWVLPNGRVIHLDQPLAHPGLPLPKEVADAYPASGGIYWGDKGHCGIDGPGSDVIRALPIHPAALQVFKGAGEGEGKCNHPDGDCTKHPYSGGDTPVKVNGVQYTNLANYFKSMGVTVSLLNGLATSFCVGATGRDLIAGGIPVVVCLDCVGGALLLPTGVFDPKADKDINTVRAPLLDAELVQKICERDYPDRELPDRKRPAAHTF